MGPAWGRTKGPNSGWSNITQPAVVPDLVRSVDASSASCYAHRIDQDSEYWWILLRMADSNPATTMQRISKDANWNPGLCGTTWHNFLYWLTQHVQMVSQPRNSWAGHLRHSLLLSQPNSSIASPFLSTMRFAACMSCIHRDLVKSSCGHFNSNQTRRQILHATLLPAQKTGHSFTHWIYWSYLIIINCDALDFVVGKQ